jgi:glutamyl/glutaminyl-tRNA synthetase
LRPTRPAEPTDAIRISLKASGSLDTYDRRGAFLTDEEVHRKMKAGEKHVVRLKVSRSLDLHSVHPYFLIS